MFEVDMAKVSFNTIVEKVSASGMASGCRGKNKPEVAGEIIELQIKEGDSVKWEICTQNRNNFVSALNRSQANLNQQKANLAGRANLARRAGFYRSQLDFNRQSLLHKEK